jgi:glucose/arabinose dehydrogenase
VVVLGLLVLLVAVATYRLIVGGSGEREVVAGATTTTTTADGGEGTAGGSTTTTAPPLPALQSLALETVAEGLREPTYAVSPAGDPRIFVTERFGTIKVVEDGTVAPFVDLTDRVRAGGIEQGLLGLAFHPEFAENGRFFVYYTNLDGNRTLSELTVSASDPTAGDPASETVFFSLPQPPRSTDIRHYGGMLMFGPDGYLYASLGDGANATDQGQDPNTLFATIIRLDVDSGGEPYGIPADNPFVGSDEGAAEVWAYGLRNPWRFSIDPGAGLLYVADVGLETWEEVNVLDLAADAGANLGWANVEGSQCFRERPCDPTDYHVPVLQYGHDVGCSITGGHVYRGDAIPEIAGHYFYADWCTGFVRSLRYENGEIAEEEDWTEQLGGTPRINAFGVDAEGELYLVVHDGFLAKVVPVR